MTSRNDQRRAKAKHINILRCRICDKGFMTVHRYKTHYKVCVRMPHQDRCTRCGEIAMVAFQSPGDIACKPCTEEEFMHYQDIGPLPQPALEEAR